MLTGDRMLFGQTVPELTLTLENTGVATALNVTLSDMLTPETTLVSGSITVDGAPYGGSLPVVIDSILSGQSAVVSFKMTVNSLPQVNPVFNIARADYEFFPFTGYPATGFSNSNPVAVFIILRETVTYVIQANNPMTQTPVTNYATLDYTVDDPVRGNVNFSENTNTVSIDIISNRMTVVKSVDKTFAVRGDILHYTTVITNTGSLLKSDLVFTDPIPVVTSFVAGNVVVNGVSQPAYDPAAGFALPDLAVGQSVTVEFDVRVN